MKNERRLPRPARPQLRWACNSSAPAASYLKRLSQMPICLSILVSIPTGSSNEPAFWNAGTPLPHQATSDLCHEAAVRRIDNAKVDPRHRPSGAGHLYAGYVVSLDRLSGSRPAATRLAAIEVEAACAGFMYALITGAAYIVSGASDLALSSAATAIRAS